MEQKYKLGCSYQFSGLCEGMGKNISYHRDINGKIETRVLSRRGRDDRPKNYNSKEKVRKLTERRDVQKYYGRRINNLI